MKRNEDALSKKIHSLKVKRIRRNICGSILLLLAVIVILLYFVLGFVLYEGNSLSPKLSGRNIVVYFKPDIQPKSDSLIVFKDLDTGLNYIDEAKVYHELWNNNEEKHAKVLGIVIWPISIGGISQ